MRTTWVFLAGIALGLAAGAGGVLLAGRDADRDTAPAPAADPDIDHTACRTTEASLRTELETLRSRAATPEPPREVAAADPAPAEAATPDSDHAAYRAAWEKVRADLASLAEEEPGSVKVMERLAVWRRQLDVEEWRLSRLAGRAMLRLVDMGKLRPADVDRLATEFHALPSGSNARPVLAGVVARSWARDPRLSSWFDRLPKKEEPEVRQWAVWALDESPSDALRDYVLRLSRDEPNAEVLDSIWNEDIILVTLTKATAPRLVTAIEARIAAGDLPPDVRGRGIFALGLAGVHVQAEARSAVARIVGSELDQGVRKFGEAVLAAIDREESNVQALEGLWDRHRPSFGE